MLSPHPGAPALVLAVHGSALPQAVRPIELLALKVTQWYGVTPLIGHLDVRSPDVGQVLSRVRRAGGASAVVVPLLLGDGYHRTVDLPAVVDTARSEGLACVLTDGLSDEPALATALYERLRQAERRAGGLADAVLLAAAGSGRPGGNAGAVRTADRLRVLLGEERGPVPVVTGYCSATGPSVTEAYQCLRAQGHRRVAVATYLLAPGRFTCALRDLGAWAASAPLADHPVVARLVGERYVAARSVFLTASGE
ncbi:CbiX/SirB N-terminal domain-containing protein [Streptomyces sp. NPDC003077]|uniref:sirohydrochlorin chelatase n=1 Tax=Streptomyces sp. NPDC003077 TaxID=3154443 RepID=UPI0033A98962